MDRELHDPDAAGSQRQPYLMGPVTHTSPSIQQAGNSFHANRWKLVHLQQGQLLNQVHTCLYTPQLPRKTLHVLSVALHPCCRSFAHASGSLTLQPSRKKPPSQASPYSAHSGEQSPKCHQRSFPSSAREQRKLFVVLRTRRSSWGKPTRAP